MDRYSEYSKVRRYCVNKTKQQISDALNADWDSHTEQICVDGHYYQLSFDNDDVKDVKSID